MKVAWHEMPGNAPQRPRPVGHGMKALLVPKVFFLQIRAVLFEECQILLLKGSCPMMFLLLFDVLDRFGYLRDTNAECPLTLLPSKVPQRWEGLMYAGRRSCLY